VFLCVKIAAAGAERDRENETVLQFARCRSM